MSRHGTKVFTPGRVCPECHDELIIWKFDKYGRAYSEYCPVCNQNGKRSDAIYDRLRERQDEWEQRELEKMEVHEWNKSFRIGPIDHQSEVLNELLGSEDPSIIARVESRFEELGWIFRDGEWWNREEWESSFGNIC